MRRLSPLAWMALLAAAAGSGLMLAKIPPLVMSPPVLHALVRPPSAPRYLGVVELVLAMDDGVHFYSEHGAWWIKPDLTVVERNWPDKFAPLRIDAIAVHPPEVALLATPSERTENVFDRVVVIVSPEQTLHVTIPVSREQRLFGLRAVDAGGYEILVYDSEKRTMQSVRFTRDSVKPGPAMPLILDDYINEVIWKDETPLAVLERHEDKHSFVELATLDGKPQPLPDGVRVVQTTALLEGYGDDVRFLDRHGAPVSLPKGQRGRVFVVSKDEVLPLAGDRDPLGASETVFDGRRLAVRRSRNGTDVQTNGSWRTIASDRAVGLTPIPVGDRWLVTAPLFLEKALIVDANGNRLDRIPWREDLRRKTGDPSLGWLVLLAALLPATMATLLVIWRARRRLAHAPPTGSLSRPGSIGFFVGTLVLPAGQLLHSAGRRVKLVDGAALQLGAERVPLAGDVRRIDVRADLPLVDSDAIYLVGQLEPADDGGPFRATPTPRFVGKLAIGRGDASEYAAHQTTLANRVVLRAALLNFLLCLIALYHFGVAPTSW